MPTKIKATAGLLAVTGHSGNGHRIHFLIQKAKHKEDARDFYNALVSLEKERKLKRKLMQPAHYTSVFSCAEPHAVALLLSKGARLGDIRLPVEAYGEYGSIQYCRNCEKWIDNGVIVLPDRDDTASTSLSSYSADLSDYEDQKCLPEKGTSDWDDAFPTLSK